MSLNKTLDRLFDEIRREAKRNPDFANRLDAVMRAHASRRDVPEEVAEDVTREEAPPSAPKPQPVRKPIVQSAPAPSLNPAGLYKREGEDALVAALAPFDAPALSALIAEHNLDPSGAAAGLDRAALAAHIVIQAKRRAERDEKLFDY
jgi:hypothetical protein